MVFTIDLILWGGAMRYIFVFSFCFSIISSASQFKGLNCTHYDSSFLGRAVPYCVHRSHSELGRRKGDKIVYFFHGMNGSAKHWESTGYAEVLNTLSQEPNFPQTTFVSFDTEGMSFFSDHKDKTEGGKAYESWLIEEFMPYIETELETCTTRECRATVGLSMGGFGALKIALRNATLFSAAAANCPALAPMNIYDEYVKWKAYFNRHPIGSFKGGFMLQMIKGVFSNWDSFEDNDPSTLVKDISDKEMPALYFDAGGKDYYGFQEGFERMKKVLNSKNAKYLAHFEPNMGHEISTKTRWDAMRFLRQHFNRD